MNNQDNSWKSLLSGSNGIKAISLAGGVGLHAVNVFLATTILPSVVKDIGGLAFFSWNTTLFVTASIIGSVLSARLLSQKGPKRAYQLSIIIFSVGSLCCALAPAMPIMLIGRFVQGLGGGLLFALSYSMIRLVFEKTLWSRAIALISGMWGIAALSGPFIGGIFAELGVWRLSFGSILIISAVLFLVISKVLPKEDTNEQLTPAPPILKLFVLTAATIFVSIGSITSSLAVTIGGVMVSVLLILLLVKLEKGSTNRLLPRGSYLLSSDLGATYAAMGFLAAATAVEIYIPYFLQEIHYYSPLKAGYLTIVMAMGWTVFSILFSGASSQRIVKIWHIGPVIMASGLACLAFIMPNANITPSLSLALICLSLVLIGGGIGMGWPHLLTKALSSAMKGEEDQAAASLTTVQLIATAFGAAFTGLITALAGINNVAEIENVKNAAFVLFSVFAISPLMTLFIVRKYLTKTNGMKLIYIFLVSLLCWSADGTARDTQVINNFGTLSLNTREWKSIQVKDETPVFLADPTVFYFDGVYYLYGTSGTNPNLGFEVYTSTDLKRWEKPEGEHSGWALSAEDVYGDKGFWAPQVFFYNNLFYMAYTANENIAIATANHPLGPFKQTLKNPLKSDVKQIDPFILIDEDGKKYLYHVRLSDGNRLFVAEMTDDLSAIKEKTLRECIIAEEAWENTQHVAWPVAEGPSVFRHNGLYYFIYSANDFRNPDYAVGYATSESPYGPWKKSEGNPIFNKELAGINGTGHGDVFRDKKGKLRYVLHTHFSDQQVAPRRTALVEMEFIKKANQAEDILRFIPESFYFVE